VRDLAILPAACHRTRQHVSLRLDRQLSEIEVAVMEHHLARCPACSSFAEELEGVTEALRSADLVEPPIRFDVAHRPVRVGVTRAAGAAAAAAVLVSVAVGAVAGLGPGSSAPDRYLGDLQGAQDARSIQEHFALVSDGSNVTTPVTPRGVTAAEETTVAR
jgi:predicted anti-sigma-YlaC factor YlaD